MARQSSPKCAECNGSGFLHEYSHISGGRCFTCNGTGREIARKAKAVKVGQQSAHILALADAFQIEHIIDWLTATESRDFLTRELGTTNLIRVAG